MARLSRPLKSEFWEDDKVAELSLEAQLTLAGLITKHADDEGRFVATTQAIHGAIYPLRNITASRIKKWMSEIETLDFVVIYQVGAGTYGWLPNWSKHMKVPHPSPSTLPAPPKEHS